MTQHPSSTHHTTRNAAPARLRTGGSWRGWPPGRLYGLLATAALVLLVHGALLGALQGDGLLSPEPGPRAAPVLMRQVLVHKPGPAPARDQITQAPPPADTAAPKAPLAPSPSAAVSPGLVEPLPAARVAAAASAAAPMSAASAAAAASAAPLDVAVHAEPAAASAAATSITATTTTATSTSATATTAKGAEDSAASQPGSADGVAAGTPIPVYTTQPAPAATLVFDLKRGLAAGQATLQWQPEASPGRYVLTLQAQAFGITVAGWNSQGGFDAAGLAPERYTETRRGRDVRATNFQRSAGKISFSVQSNEVPLAAGAQDRSSWMLQLGAVLNANPAQALPGAQTTLVVAGTRGTPEPWIFTVVDRAPLTLGDAGTNNTVADAVQLLREPRRPYDTRARIWLDPARHHLPLKVQLRVQATGEGQEFELRRLTMP